MRQRPGLSGYWPGRGAATGTPRILAQLRAARDPAGPAPIPRDYRRTGHPASDPVRLAELLTDRLVDYRARVHQCTVDGVGAAVATVLDGVLTVAVPPDVPGGWLSGYHGGVVVDGRPLTFVSGPSATSDIELIRVEGVPGPRQLDVIMVQP